MQSWSKVCRFMFGKAGLGFMLLSGSLSGAATPCPDLSTEFTNLNNKLKVHHEDGRTFPDVAVKTRSGQHPERSWWNSGDQVVQWLLVLEGVWFCIELSHGQNAGRRAIKLYSNYGEEPVTVVRERTFKDQGSYHSFKVGNGYHFSVKIAAHEDRFSYHLFSQTAAVGGVTEEL